MKSYFTVFCFLLLFLVATFTTSFAQTDWKKYEGNPVLSPGPTGAWDEVVAAAPSVLFDGSTYHMWYWSLNDNYEGIGYATSTDGIAWTKYNDPSTTGLAFAVSDPVLNKGPLGSWDDSGVFGPYVLRIDNTYHMWYGGNDGSDHFLLGHATSTDGITWEKDLSNPVLRAGPDGTWESGGIEPGSVVFDGNTYHMWYHGWHSGIVRIGHATSPDMITWTKDPNNPVLDIGSYGSWDVIQVRRPNVLFDGTTFHMWYSGGVHFRWHTGYAWSCDGIHWTKYDNNPVLSIGGTGSWDVSSASWCSVLWDPINNTYKMWYSGSDEAQFQTGYATAPRLNTIVYPGDTDNNGKVEAADVLPVGVYFLNKGLTRANTGVSWEAEPAISLDNPATTYADANGDGLVDEKDVIAIGVNWGNTHSTSTNSYQISLTDSAAINKHRDNFRTIYNNLDGNSEATREIKKLLQNVLGIEESVPQTFALYQNYPNPFNPTTTIEYQIPLSGGVRGGFPFVQLEIYNLLGQKVSTLVSGKQEAGIYTVEWNAVNFSSGIYFYNLKTKNGFTKTRKMLFVK